MPSAFIGAGIAEGAAAIPGEISRRKEAKQRQELGQLKINEYNKQAPLRESQQTLELQELKNQLRQAQSQGLQQLTYESFNSFDSDGDTRHLNNFLERAKQNVVGQRMFAGIVRYDNVTRSTETEDMLKRVGITDIDGYFEDPRGAGNYVLATSAAGEKKLIDMDQIYNMTGYTKQMNAEKLAIKNTRSLIAQRMRGGESKVNLTALERVAKQMAESENIPFHEAYQLLQKGVSSKAGTSIERLANQIMEDEDIPYLDAMERAIEMKQPGTGMEREARRIAEDTGRDYNEVFEELKTRKTRTTAQKSIDEIDIAKDNLDKAFKGDFLSADLTKPGARTKAGRLISRIEKDFPMSTADRKIAIELRQLTGLAKTAGADITDAEAGPLDSLFRNIKKYISNEVEGTTGTSAYEAFRNTLRHALYGAALSKGEISAFNSAAGTLSEQLGPVMVKLRTQTEELKSKLTAVYDLNDEYVAKYRLNMSLDDISNVVSALDERIDLISGVKIDKTATTLTPGQKRPLGEYFNRGTRQ